MGLIKNIKKIVHVFKASSFATSPSLIYQICSDAKRNEMIFSNHAFVLFGTYSKQYEHLKEDNEMSFFDDANELTKFLMQSENNYIIVHGIPFKGIFRTFSSTGIQLSKVAWINWGHGHTYSRRHVFRKLSDKFLMKKLKGIIALTKHDEFLMNKVYNGCNIKFLPYRMSKMHRIFDNTSTLNHTTELKVLLGVSAGKPQCHIEGLRCLEKLDRTDFSVYCPLSYNNADKDYLATVKKKGVEIFGKRFVGLENLMPFEEYAEFLKKIDFLILPSLKQNGLFNIYLLLFFGKKIFVIKDSNIYYSLNNLGFKIETIDSLEFNAAIFEPYDLETQKHNRKLIVELLDDKKTIKRLVDFYSELCK